jgi:hypothetical protein
MYMLEKMLMASGFQEHFVLVQLQNKFVLYVPLLHQEIGDRLKVL